MSEGKFQVHSGTRRQFLKSAAGYGAALGLAPEIWAQPPNASDGPRMAVIGLHSRGGSHLQGLGQYVHAICDVDAKVLGEWQTRLEKTEPPRKVRAWSDYRKLLESKDIDAVSIATPNHSHASIAIAAVQAGKHVYVEKPISQTVWEGRQLVNAARKYGRAVQCGTQSRSNPALYAAKNFLDQGELGTVQYAVATCYKYRPSIGKLDQPLSIPPDLDYDLWCGPASKVDIFRPQLHYDWHWDFNTGNGDLGNQGVHQMDIARWFLGEDQLPARVLSVGGRLGYVDAGNTANTQVVYLDFPKAPILFEVRGLPRRKQTEEMDIYLGSRVGVVIQCTKGHLLIPSYTEAFAFDSAGKQLHRWQYGDDQFHYNNFVNAVVKDDPQLLNSDASVGHASSRLCHLANISYRTGKRASVAEIRESAKSIDLLADAVDRMLAHLDANEIPRDALELIGGLPLEIDVANEGIQGSDDASRLLRREDRAPFVIPEISV